MRLIDADALIEALMSYTWHDEDGYEIDDCEEKRNYIKAWMPDVPTIQPDAPRVMTLEEVLGGDECWIEGRSGACGYGDALISDDGERVDFYRPHSIDTLDFYAYDKEWRCWTARPTEEQMDEVKWDEGQ